MIPPGFEELGEDTNLWYRIEPDGSVLFTGEQPRSAKMLNEQLPDGSKIVGGFNRQGVLFGERLSLNRGQVVKSPLHWRDYNNPRSVATSSSRPVPSARVMANERPKSPLDNPIFNPSKPSAIWSNPLLGVPPNRVMPETAALLESQGVQTHNLQESRDRLSKVVKANEAPPKEGRMAASVRKLLNKKNGHDEGGGSGHLDMIKEAADAIETTMAEVERVRAQNAQNVAELHQAQSENQQLRNELERVRSEAKSLLAQTIEEFGRKVKVRRWQVEAVPTNDVTIEGQESRILEVEDPEGLMRYVVVSHAPTGTSPQVLQQWQQDLRAQVDLMPFGSRAVYVYAPPGMRVDVLELVPGVNVEDSAGQF